MDEPNILIKTALSEAVQKVNAGMSPTEALKKVAEDLDLNPNYIQRTGEALNVALNYKHFKTASDRSTDFEIADISKAIQDAFTFTEKTAAEKISERFSVAETNEHIFNYNRALSNPMYKRAFLEIANAPEVNESYPTTFNTVYEKSANYIQSLNKQAEEAEVARVEAEFELNAKFSELSDAFRKDAGYRTSFDEFESQVFSKYGQAALPYLDLLHKTAAQHEERGVHDSGYIMFEQCKEAQMFEGLMSAASQWTAATKTAEEISENLNFEKAYLKDSCRLLGKQSATKCCGKCTGECKCASSCSCQKSEDADKEKSAEEVVQPHIEADPVLEEIKKKASDESYKIAKDYTKDPVLKEAMEKEAFLGLGKSTGFGGLISEHVSEAFSAGFKPHNTAPKPNMTLDNMERKLLLQELMMTDPILSKINPARVARAFEQLLRLSPEISKEKEVVRAELRAMVSSQALSKFDADLMAKTDVGMLKRRIATQNFNSGHMDTFRI
jgi:hypothetical protein